MRPLRLATRAALLLAAACSKSPTVETRLVTLHAPSACAPGASPFAVFAPFGDFEPQGTLPSFQLANTGMALEGLPANTLELVGDVTDLTGAAFEAHGLLAPAGNVNLLVLPSGSPCALTDATEARTGAVLGAVDETHVLVVGGTLASNAVPETALVNLAHGTVSALPVGLLVPRTEATVTAWSGGAIVAGGVLPSAGNEPQATFEVYSSAAGDFGGTSFTLSHSRYRHGAAVLASGETLLVGGKDASGQLLGSMEVIDGATSPPHARTGGLGALAVPRADPVVMRLASGEILVAGGVDASNAPVSTLEWFPADAGPAVKPTAQLVSSSHTAFLPLDAGGALAVILPDPGAPTPFQNVWVISADGGLQPATSITGTLSDARLFDGPAQEPVLWTGDRWLVWQPWSGTFDPLLSAIGTAGPTGDPVATSEPGLGVWLDGTVVHALRFGTRGPYATTPATAPLLLSSTSFTAPDRFVGLGATSPATFDPTVGLSLQSGASVFVTDATFASFTLDASTPGASPPAVVLRDTSGNETVLTPSVCPFKPGSTLHVERSGASVQVSTDGGALVTCSVGPAASARVSIGVRGVGSSGASSVVRALVVTRT